MSLKPYKRAKLADKIEALGAKKAEEAKEPEKVKVKGRK